MPTRSSQPLATWLVGSDPSCDIVINHSTVSGQHCRLSQYDRGFILEDLGSTNGTYVDGHRLTPRTPVAVTQQQQVTLGRNIPVVWPRQAAERSSSVSASGGSRVIRIGRSPESDVVLDYPMISWDHARIVQQNGEYILEDLNSRNGTAVNQIQNRITRARITPQDDVYLGSFKIPASRLLQSRQRTAIGEAAFQPVTFKGDAMVIGRDPRCDQPLNYPMISWHHARLSRSAGNIFVEDLGSLNGTFVDGKRIKGRVQVQAGQAIGLGSFRFQLTEGGELQRREYHGNVSIEAVGLTVCAADGNRLLDPISLTVYPSELVALMGPAGAGKTTLLKALNGYSPPADGKVLFNGSDLYESYDLFRQQMGYVPQDDIVHAQLTVREALYFATKLRTDLSDEEIEDRINKILTELKIHEKKNSIIGSPENKVLSGGQRKRVNIAMELISDTPVLFLDEPTSGLSSYDAEGVVDLLRRLASEGKTIITTIHQPSLTVFRKFDNLIMISRNPGGCGALAFFGPAYPDSIEFFDPKSAQAAKSQTGQDLSPEMLLTGLDKASTAEWVSRYGNSRYRKQFVEDRSGKLPAGAGQTGTESRGFNLTQWWTLVRRNVILKVRDRAQFIILLLQAPLFAALIGIVFRHLAEPKDVNDMALFQKLSEQVAGIHFLMVVAAVWFGCNNAARDIVGEWTVYQRERMVNLKLPSYVFSKFAVLFALCVFQCVTLLGIVFLVCGLQGGIQAFLASAGILIVASLVGAALGLAISSRSKSTESAIALLPVVLLPIIALGGGIRAVWKMGDVGQTVSYVVPSRWAYEANLLEEARHEKCGYFQAAHWDSCPPIQGSLGMDAATMVFPEYVAINGDSKAPAQLPEGTKGLRHSYWEGMGALGVMLVVLLSAVLGFLKLRDIH